MTQKVLSTETIKVVAQLLFDDWAKHWYRERYFGANPEKINGDDAQQLLWRCVDGISQRSPKGLFLLGHVGTGKTCFLWLVLREYARRMSQEWISTAAGVIENCGYDNHSDMATYLIRQSWLPRSINAQWYSHQYLIRRLRSELGGSHGDTDTEPEMFNTGIVFIDDFMRGHDDASSWNASLQFEFFDHRWRRRLPTLVTTNRTGEELRSLGDAWDATIDRLGDPEWMIGWTMAGESRRKPR